MTRTGDNRVAEHIGVSVSIAPPRLFGKALPALLDELNAALTP